MQTSLFSTHDFSGTPREEASSEIRVVALSPSDHLRATDDWRALLSLLAPMEASYPGIRRWLEKKVAPGLSSSRSAFVAYVGSEPVASAVLKKGEHAKFCNLRVLDPFQDKGIGEMFFSLMAMEARRSGAEEIHFTLPESLWHHRQGFFQSFGFENASRANVQYRLFDEELRCSAPASRVVEAAASKHPKLDAFGGDALLMSIKPRYAEKILAGEKQVEIRKLFPQRWAGCKITVYASAPTSAIMGEVTIANVVYGSPEEIWASFGPKIGCTHEDYASYTKGSREISAILLHDPVPYNPPIKRKDLAMLSGADLRPPQSYMTLGAGTSWHLAIQSAKRDTRAHARDEQPR